MDKCGNTLVHVGNIREASKVRCEASKPKIQHSFMHYSQLCLGTHVAYGMATVVLVVLP